MNFDPPVAKLRGTFEDSLLTDSQHPPKEVEDVGCALEHDKQVVRSQRMLSQHLFTQANDFAIRPWQKLLSRRFEWAPGRHLAGNIST